MSGSGPTLHDAYIKWLKIPEGQLPPDHYAILGLPRFENDTAKIKRATLDRTILVKPKCLRYHEVGSLVLNQIARASVCLTNADDKAAYDNTLRSNGVTAAVQLARQEAAADEARPAATPGVAPAKAAGAAGRRHTGGKPFREERGKINAPPSRPADNDSRSPPDTDSDFELTLSDDDEFDLSVFDQVYVHPEDSGGDFDLSLDDELDLLIAKSRHGNDTDLQEDIDDGDEASGADLAEEVVQKPAEALSENRQAMLLVGVLAVVVLVVFGGLIAYSMSGADRDDDSLAAVVPQQAAASPGEDSAAKPAMSGLNEWLPKTDDSQPSGVDVGGGGALAGGSEPSSGTSTADPNWPVDEGRSKPIEPVRPLDTELQPVATPALERFYGSLVRIEQHAGQIVLAVQVTQSEPIIDPDQPPSPLAPADPFGAAETRPVQYNFMIGAIAKDADFARGIADYESLEEQFDQTAAQGAQGEFVDAAAFAIQGDSVELVGVRTADGGSPFSLLPGAVAVELRSIQKTGQPETLAEVGKRRATYIDPSIAARRTPLHRLLRGSPAGFGEMTAMIPGTIQDASDAANIVFLPDGSTQSVVIRVTTRFPFSQGNLLTEAFAHINLTAAFDGKYDDIGRPILLARTAQPSAASVDGAPDGEAQAGVFDDGAIGTGVREPPPQVPGGDVYGPGAPQPAPLGDGIRERWYVMRIFDRFSKTNSWIVVQGRQGQVDAKQTYAGPGITVSAESGSYASPDAAEAAANRLSVTRGPKF